MSQQAGNQHVGLFIEDGSGGLVNDLVFYGGMYGARFGNQQYTARNLTFYNAQTAAINQIWDWGWTYKSLSINNCPTGILISDTSTAAVTIIDSTFTNVNVAISSQRVPGSSTPPSAGSLMLDNVVFNNVNNVLVNPQGTIIPGGSGTVNGFATVRFCSISVCDVAETNLTIGELV
jgi:glucan 1,3-beta-glucosidase